MGKQNHESRILIKQRTFNTTYFVYTYVIAPLILKITHKNMKNIYFFMLNCERQYYELLLKFLGTNKLLLFAFDPPLPSTIKKYLYIFFTIYMEMLSEISKKIYLNVIFLNKKEKFLFIC